MSAYTRKVTNDVFKSRKFLKAKVAEILSIPNDENWNVEDAEGDLVLIHATDHRSLIRGEIVNIKTKEIVCHSMGPICSVITNGISLDSEGFYNFVDTNGIEHQLPTDSRIEEGLEGTTIRVWWDGEKTRYSTHRRIDCSKSRWVVTKTFFEMFEELGGPQDLGHCNGQTFFFLIVHPDIQVVCPTEIGKGRIIFLGVSKVSAIPDSLIKELNTKYPRDKTIDPERVKVILDSSEDHRFGNQGFVIVSYGFKRIRVVSPNYDWKFKMLDDPNVAFTFYSLVNDSFTRGKFAISKEDYLKKYPLIARVEISVIKELQGKVNFKLSNDESIVDNKETRLHNIFLVLYSSLSPSRRDKLYDAYVNFFKEKERVIEWIFDLYTQKIDFEKNKITYKKKIVRIGQIITELNKLNREEDIKIRLTNLIGKEDGTTLYHMGRAIGGLIREIKPKEEVKEMKDEEFPALCKTIKV